MSWPRAGPKVDVISCGTDNKFRHPHAETLDRLAGTGGTMLCTDQNGIVEVVTDGEQLRVHTDGEPPAQ